MSTDTLGQMVTQAEGKQPVRGAVWAADNGCFSARWNPQRWWTWLQTLTRDACAFAVAPDVVADAAATRKLATLWLSRIRATGFPVAYVAQDGTQHTPPPWDEFDVLFIGGTTSYKLGPEARRQIDIAHAHNIPVHMGRVNSEKRLRYARHLGCSSVDGTYLTYAPDKLLPIVLAWLRDNDQLALWEPTA